MDVPNFHNIHKDHANLLYVLLVDDQMNKSSNIYHHVSEWYDVTPTAPSINLHHLWRKWDELSSVFLENKSPDEPLLFSLIIDGRAWNRQTILPGMSLAFDLFLDALPLFALRFSELSIVLSHMKVQMKVRWQLRNYQYVRLTERNGYPIFFVSEGGTSRFMAQNGFFKPLYGEPYYAADLPSAFAKTLNCQLPKLREFDWVPVQEIKPGLYLLPAGYCIFTSLTVFLPLGTEPSRLKLRPTFRHSYLLHPGHNCFDLFFQDFYLPASHTSYYLEGRPGLQISIRVGWSTLCPVQKPVHPLVFTLPAPAHLITKNGWIYQRTKTEVRFLDVVNEKNASRYTCVLALHERIGQDSKLRVYFQLAELHETMLFREIWEFLDDGDEF